MGEADELSPALPDNVEALATRVLSLADDRDWRLATAESCTGGLLASLLTDVEGKSSAFERGFVTYSLEAKCELLHLACARIDGETMHREEHFGDIGRGPVRVAAARMALELFEEALS